MNHFMPELGYKWSDGRKAWVPVLCCPKCQSENVHRTYEVDKAIIPDGMVALKCGDCYHIWWATIP